MIKEALEINPDVNYWVDHYIREKVNYHAISGKLVEIGGQLGIEYQAGGGAKFEELTFSLSTKVIHRHLILTLPPFNPNKLLTLDELVIWHTHPDDSSLSKLDIATMEQTWQNINSFFHDPDLLKLKKVNWVLYNSTNHRLSWFGVV